MGSWNSEVDHLKDYLFLESYLLGVLSCDQLLGLLVNLTLQIYLLITPTISLCDDECTIYHASQVPLISPHPNQVHIVTILASFLHSYDDHDVCTIFHQLQVGVLSCLAHKELGSIIQSVRNIVKKYSLFMSNWESSISNNSSDLSSILGAYHAIYHFPNHSHVLTRKS